MSADESIVLDKPLSDSTHIGKETENTLNESDPVVLLEEISQQSSQEAEIDDDVAQDEQYEEDLVPHKIGKYTHLVGMKYIVFFLNYL